MNIEEAADLAESIIQKSLTPKSIVPTHPPREGSSLQFEVTFQNPDRQPGENYDRVHIAITEECVQQYIIDESEPNFEGQLTTFLCEHHKQFKRNPKTYPKRWLFGTSS